MAIVKVEKNSYTVDSLYQWDINQDLVIYGLSLATIPEIHFTNDAMDKAIVRQSTMDDAGVITVKIPNSLLQKPYKIRAYVCIYEGDTFKSLYLITIPIQARSMPLDYTLTVSDDEVYSFNALENKLENTLALSLARYDEVNQKYEEALNILEETIAEATTLEKSAEESAQASADSATSAEKSAKSSAEASARAEALIYHPPQINETTGYWQVWNFETGEYEDTDTKATPERGVEYWTEADIAEIKSYVDEAILGGSW